jgi:protein-S-isoprenylcysteine O-methyltransferase
MNADDDHAILTARLVKRKNAEAGIAWSRPCVYPDAPSIRILFTYNATEDILRPMNLQNDREFNPWLPFMVGQLTICLACLIQWGKPSPWTRVDLFSGTFLVLGALPVARSLLRPFRDRVSAEGRRERFGLTSGPGVLGFSIVLSIADFAVFLDYGHWHLTPALERPRAQAAGLVLCLVIAVYNRWTSKYRRRAFANNAVRPTLIRSGPYRYIRHPTYAGAMIQKIANALVFGSAIAWLLAVPWWVLLLRQIRIEEIHLRKLFDKAYDDYARQTAELVPGIF